MRWEERRAYVDAKVIDIPHELENLQHDLRVCVEGVDVQGSYHLDVTFVLLISDCIPVAANLVSSPIFFSQPRT